MRYSPSDFYLAQFVVRLLVLCLVSFAVCASLHCTSFIPFVYKYDGRGVKPRSNAENSVKLLLSQLSNSSVPTQKDVDLVISATKCFQVDSEIRRMIAKNKLYKDSWYWRQSGRELHLGRHKAAPIWSAEPLIYLESQFWPYGIPDPQITTITPYTMPQTPNTLPLYKIEDFKGLEADTVILILRGKVQNHNESVYVCVSRARIALIVLADRTVSLSFPTSFDWE